MDLLRNEVKLTLRFGSQQLTTLETLIFTDKPALIAVLETNMGRKIDELNLSKEPP